MADIFVGIDGTTTHMSKAVHIRDPFDNAMTFIGKLFEGSVASTESKHWFAGPDLGGFKVPQCVGWPVEFIMKARKRIGAGSTRLTVAGYSRGAYAAIRVVQVLGKMNIPVDFLILLDTVKVTEMGTEIAIGQIIDQYDASFDTAEQARKIQSVAYDGRSGRSNPQNALNIAREDYARRMQDEIYRANAAARKKGSWNWVDTPGSFVVPPNASKVLSLQRNPAVKSRDWTMGVSPMEVRASTQLDSQQFMVTHSGMGGMPFRGDLPTVEATRAREWRQCRRVWERLQSWALQSGAFHYVKHPTMYSEGPPKDWLNHKNIRSQYWQYLVDFKDPDRLTPDLDSEFMDYMVEKSRRRDPGGV